MNQIISFKNKIEMMEANPGRYFENAIKKIKFNVEVDSLEDVICTLFAGSARLSLKTFDKLSEQILEYPFFHDDPLYQYYFNIAKGAFYRNARDLEPTLRYYEFANRFSNHIGDPELFIKSAMLLAVVFFFSNDVDSALEYAEKALEVIDSSINPIYTADMFNAYGVILQQNDEFCRALKSYEQSQEFFWKVEKYKDHLNYCKLILNMAENYAQLGDDVKYNEFMEKGISMANTNGHTDYLGGNLPIMADYLENKGHLGESISYLKCYTNNLIIGKQNFALKTLKEEKVRLKEDFSALHLLRERNQRLSQHLNNLYIEVEATDKRLQDQAELLKEIDRAIHTNSFFAHYQPQFSLPNKKLIGAEALIRWYRDDGKVVSPNSFIDVVDESVIINDLSKIIIRQAFELCREMRKKGDEDFIISINLTPYQMVHWSVSEFIRKETLIAGIPLENVKVEITEQAILNHDIRALREIKSLKRLGVKLAMDDFGSGYSSLACISDIPFDMIKIDRSLIKQTPIDSSATMMLQGLIQLMHTLDKKVIVEGVENEDQISLLIDCHCEAAQGFHLGKPVDKDTFLHSYL